MLDLPVALLAMSVIGIVAFAASGALVGARAGMDWLGVSTLAAVTAIGGGHSATCSWHEYPAG